MTELSAAEGQRVIGEAIAALTTSGFGAVITPSDAVAAGVIAGLREAGLVPGDLSVTGMGGTLQGTQAVVAGDQLLTTWEPDAPASSVAAALACGQATGVGLPTGIGTTPVDDGAGEVPTVLLTGVVVTRDGSVDGTRSVEDSIVAGRAYGPDTAASICTQDLAQACDDLGMQ
ncbi:MAG: substrate-binding domain-containing protein [Chloroflexota bacterium]